MPVSISRILLQIRISINFPLWYGESHMKRLGVFTSGYRIGYEFTMTYQILPPFAFREKLPGPLGQNMIP